MPAIHGAVEFTTDNELWFEVINVGNLLLRHNDLNGCLFGVDNYAQFEPLFPFRGVPANSVSLTITATEEFPNEDLCPSWALWSELVHINWDELALANDQRTAEFIVHPDGRETFETKWLNRAGLESVKEALDLDPKAEIRIGDRIYRRLLLRRRDALDGNDFPLLMRLMACLAERFGEDNVRIVVWFA